LGWCEHVLMIHPSSSVRVSTVCHCAGVAMFSKSTCIPHRLVHHRSCRAAWNVANLTAITTIWSCMSGCTWMCLW
jgi:hypothetical protein